MTPVNPSGAVLFAKDVARVARFYRELLGLTVVAADADRVVLRRPGVELVVHGLPAEVARTLHIGTPPPRRAEMPIKLTFFVPSLDQARDQLAALGGELDPPSRIWSVAGFRACDAVDPEGNVLQLRDALVPPPSPRD